MKHSGGFHIGEGLDRLELEEHGAVADEIGAIRSSKSDSFRVNRHGLLSLERDVPLPQLDLQEALTHRLQ
jgi:hypothetical protein